MDAIRNNKKSTSDQDPKEKQKEVINNLIELSQKNVEMSSDNEAADKSNEERTVAEAVANLTPQVVLNRLKDTGASKSANVESEDQRLTEAQNSSRTHKDIDSHQNNDEAEKETSQETPEEAPEIAPQNDNVDNDEVFEENVPKKSSKRGRPKKSSEEDNKEQ